MIHSGRTAWTVSFGLAVAVQVGALYAVFRAPAVQPEAAAAVGSGQIAFVSAGTKGSASQDPRRAGGEVAAVVPAESAEPVQQPAEAVPAAQPEMAAVKPAEPVKNALPTLPSAPLPETKPIKAAETAEPVRARPAAKPVTPPTPVRNVSPRQVVEAPTKAPEAPSEVSTPKTVETAKVDQRQGEGGPGRSGDPEASGGQSATVGASASAGGSGGAASSSAPASYKGLLLGWLERHKSYPPRARSRRQEGTVVLRFTIDRAGKLVAYRIERGSGFPLLDAAVAEMVERADPFPAMPAEFPPARLELLVPVEFALR